MIYSIRFFKGMRIRAGSLRGRLRKNNEDSFAVILNYGDKDSEDFLVMAAVADGMGGGDFGEVASSLLLRNLTAFFSSEIHRSHDLFQIKREIPRVLRDANRDIMSYGKENGAEWMGTTLALFCAEKGKGLVANVGDSRVYVMRDDGEIVFRTKDHSAAQELLDSGEPWVEDLRWDYVRNQLTRAVGISEECEADISVLDILSGYSVLLCTDGLWERIYDEEMARAVKEEQEPLGFLVNLALERGSTDDLTGVLIQI